MASDTSQILNLVGQLGGNHQQTAPQLHGMDQVDPQQHAGLLNQIGVDPQQLQNGGYQQHLDGQQQTPPGFNGYQQGQDYSTQQPNFNSGGQVTTSSSRVGSGTEPLAQGCSLRVGVCGCHRAGRRGAERLARSGAELGAPTAALAVRLTAAAHATGAGPLCGLAPVAVRD